MYNKKISVTLYKLNDADLHVKAEYIINCLTNNVYFTNPSPSLAQVKTALQEFSTAITKAKYKSSLDIIIKKEKRDHLLILLKSLALYVQLTGENNETALNSSGFTVNKDPQPIGILPKPTNFRIKAMHPGAIKVSLRAIYGAKMYLYEYRIKGETTWQSLSSTRVNVLVTNLTKSAEYEFRVLPMGASLERVYSDVLSSVVL